MNENGADLTVFDNNPVKLQLATKLGATDIVDVRNGDPVEQVKE